MKLTKKTSGLILVLLGLLLLILGFLFSKMSDSYKGVNVQTGYMVNGEHHVTGSGTAGGNPEGEERFHLYSICAFVMAAGFILGGIINIFQYQKEMRLPIKRKACCILACQGLMVSIQFKDGSREKMIMEPSVVLTKGDVGYVEIRGNKVVGFTTAKK